jgi:hypothetical protein
MPWKSVDFISEADVGIAYRKAKADIFYQSGHPNFRDFCEFEKDLIRNLESLHTKLESGDLSWMTDPKFLGTWSVIPKKIDQKNEVRPGLRWSNPDKAWRDRVDAKEERVIAKFRQVGVHSVEFHIVSALWMLKVGGLYDAKLKKEAYGSRLRRQRPPAKGKVGQINTLSSGSFKPYLQQYERWRDDGISVIQQSLNQDKRIVAVTADIRQFYHQVGPRFLVSSEYLEAAELADQIVGDKLSFTNAIIDAIEAWASRTPLHKSKPAVGLPLGLPASSLIANVALLELDRDIRRELSPLYYGRYVDDILLVMENTRNFQREKDVWDFISDRVRPLKSGDEPNELKLELPYLGEGEIVFVGDKQKVFILEGDTGKAIVETIDRQIRERNSEWRALPDIPEREEALAADLLVAIGEDGEEVDSLRRADRVSMHRAAFAIRLRDIEAFEQNLSSSAWAKQKKIFSQDSLRPYFNTPTAL